MNAISHRAAECLKFLIAEAKANGVSPSYEKISLFLGVNSKSTVSRLLDELEHADLIRRPQGLFAKRYHGIEVLPDAEHHSADCLCNRCAHRRYAAQIRLVQALRVEPPARLLRANPDNICLISTENRAALLGVAPNNKAATRTRTAVPGKAS